MNTPFCGVIPPLVTPLTVDGELDLASLERLITRLLDSGVHGLFALGSSGEVAFFDDDMRAQVLDAVTGIVAGQVPVLAGCIDTQTHRVVSHIRAAEKTGVTGVVVTAPFYAITGQEEIRHHFTAIGEAATVPVLAYDIPVCVHTKLAPEMLMDLARTGAIVGVKDSSGDDVSFRRLALQNRAEGEPLALFTGHEVVVDGAYLSGAHGCVPGLGNVDPAGYVRLHTAAQAGDWEQVRLEQDRLAHLMEIAFAPVGKVGPAAGVGSFKTALQLLGVFDTNTMSAPMTALEGSNVDAVQDVLQKVGLL
ncbi:4-hydroxy-tetrahydrodipicolinate synthase [Austwickia chelonae]|uniref:Dihydrodipicolinate synthase n=1 Tax=Austwickia chelonae NBRC 105200 TaxID=1184607 RepID=K6WA67_9MICO|nr:dihydrodipicolinate synthase family protein [Austwickia chelonae]GAB78732.1 dihydrodipicolinate synthase [Austwickia chelonae NBRC 105200]SEW35126.1 4-hydroxy-tetrahydrodipicolinate synthase [Austwickia chelonae]